MNFSGYYMHPENPQITRAFLLVRRGKRDEAIRIIEAEGYEDAEHQVELIEGFIRHLAANIIKKERKARTKKWTLPKNSKYKTKAAARNLSLSS
jgi:hypothetical protein